MKTFCYLLPLFFILPCSGYSQQVQTQKVTPFKPPIVNTFLGNHPNNDTVNLEEGSKILSLPLIVKDSKGVNYKIVTYQFLYRRKSYIEDSATGKLKANFTINVSRFDSARLSPLWAKNISEGLRSDEEFYYFDILVQDEQGRKFNAPDLKIFIFQPPANGQIKN